MTNIVNGQVKIQEQRVWKELVYIVGPIPSIPSPIGNFNLSACPHIGYFALARMTATFSLYPS